MYLDVSMFKQLSGERAVKLTKLNDTLTVTFRLPEELICTDSSVTRTYQIVRVHGGAAEILDAAYDAETRALTFETDRFSTYAVIYADVSNSSPNTGDNAPLHLWTAALFAGGAGLFAAAGFGKKREEGEEN